MFDSACVPLKDTGKFSSLLVDYLQQKPELKAFYHRFPSLEAAAAQMEEKAAHYPAQRRVLLSQALKQQYAALDLPEAHPVRQNLEHLAQSHSFTVVTGHQLNILTGPLYFVYKIASTLHLARQLGERYPEKTFVPVFWMASEDHDFAEISFVNLYGGRLQWQHNPGGAVGRLAPHGLGKVLDELEQHLGEAPFAAELMAIFRRAYHEQDTLAEATRALAHALFGEEGLVIIGGDDPLLKREMIPYFQQELLEQPTKQRVEETSQSLEETYHRQVHPREINLFHLRPGHRARILREGDQWQTADGAREWDQEALLKELEEAPEHFSPNALLRPLYQEVLLPNLAYIGGGGEIAYWLQLRGAFDHFQVPFPMLTLRSSAMLLSQKWGNRVRDLALSPDDLFLPLEKLQKEYVRRHAELDTDLGEYEDQLAHMFAELEELAQHTEKSMLGAVAAQRAKQLRGLEKLKKRLLRAEKRRQQTVMDKLERIHEALHPGGHLQERHDTLAPYYAQYGPAFLSYLVAHLDPLQACFYLVEEQAQDR